MRGSDERSASLFSYVDLEGRVRSDHPLRTIREIANAALADLTGEFAVLYPLRLGRPSIPPEVAEGDAAAGIFRHPLGTAAMERVEFDLLFRWFVGLGVDDPVWDHSSFTKNRDRLLEGEIVAKFLAAVVAQATPVKTLRNDPQLLVFRPPTATAVSTTSRGSNTALDLWTAISAVLYPTDPTDKTVFGGGVPSIRSTASMS